MDSDSNNNCRAKRPCDEESGGICFDLPKKKKTGERKFPRAVRHKTTGEFNLFFEGDEVSWDDWETDSEFESDEDSMVGNGNVSEDEMGSFVWPRFRSNMQGRREEERTSATQMLYFEKAYPGFNLKQKLVKSLEDMVDTTSQYETLCLSFPRRNMTEIGFAGKVLDAAALYQNLDEAKVLSPQIENKYTDSAEEVMKNFKEKLTEDRHDYPADLWEEDFIYSINANQTEKRMPQKHLWMFAVEDIIQKPSYEGQFKASVDTLNKTLCISLFGFSSEFSPAVVSKIKAGTIDMDVAEKIVENGQKFEVSQQMRVDADLQKISQLYLHCRGDDESEGLLVVEVDEKPRYYDRRLHTQNRSANDWAPIKKPSPSAPDIKMVPVCLYLGGRVSGLKEVVSLLLAAEPKLKDLYHQGISKPYCRTVKHEYCGKKKRKSGSLSLSAEVKERRQKIITILKSHKLIDTEKEEALRSKPARVRYRAKNGPIVNNALGNFNSLSKCLTDFINFRCRDDDLKRLDKLLGSPLNAEKEFCCEEEQFDFEEGEEFDIDSITVAEYLKKNSIRKEWKKFPLEISFCDNELRESQRFNHCSGCCECKGWREWHCNGCNHCSYGVDSPYCDNCGRLTDGSCKRLLKPDTLFHKEDWEESQSLPSKWLFRVNNRPLSWPGPQSASSGPSIQYTEEKAMKDELGLLNPVEFFYGRQQGGARAGTVPQTGVNSRVKRELGILGLPDKLEGDGEK